MTNDKFHSHQKPILLITLSTTDILNIVDEMIMPLYNIFQILANRYLVIFAVDSCIIHALNFIRKLWIQDGYIITKCGSTIYDIQERKIIKMSNLNNKKVLEIFRQAAIEFDLIVLRGQKESFIYGIDHNFIENKITEYEERFITSYDYSKAVKFIKTHRITSLQIYFNYFDVDTIEKRKQKIINLAIQNDLTVTQIHDGSFVITDFKVGECIDVILEIENQSKIIYSSLLLTNIFNNDHNLIIDEHVVAPKISIDDLYRDKVFSLFNSELYKSIKNSNLLKKI